MRGTCKTHNICLAKSICANPPVVEGEGDVALQPHGIHHGGRPTGMKQTMFEQKIFHGMTILKVR